VNHYRNFLTYFANQEAALDLRPLTVMVSPSDQRFRNSFDQLHCLANGHSAVTLEVHSLLHQYHVEDSAPPALVPLLKGQLYERIPLDAKAAVRFPLEMDRPPLDPGRYGETLFACFASLPELRQRLIIGHLTQVFGGAEFLPTSAPTHWHENTESYTLQKVPGNRLFFLWLLCALYDQHPLKLLYRPERGLFDLPSSAIDALVSAFRNASGFGQVLVVSHHSGLISKLNPEELLLLPPRNRQAIWASEMDPEFFDDKGRLLRFAMGLAA